MNSFWTCACTLGLMLLMVVGAAGIIAFIFSTVAFIYNYLTDDDEE